MIYADFDYYKNTFHGIIIEKKDEYQYFAEGAGDELAPFISRVPKDEEAQTALKRCACRITDILYQDFKSSKNGQKITSESVSGYYSVSYNNPKTVSHAVNTAISLYLGRYVLGARKVII